MYLEGIFIGGDIRSQLPEEAKKFDSIDKTFKKVRFGFLHFLYENCNRFFLENDHLTYIFVRCLLCVCVCVCVCMHACMYVHVCVYACMHVWVCGRGCMCVCNIVSVLQYTAMH